MEAVLSTRERQELVAVLRDLDPTAVQERRRSPRRKTLQNLWMQKLWRGGTKPMTKAVLVNVSVSGVGLLSKVLCLQGEKLILPLRFVEGGGWLVFCEVRNCKRLENGQYKVGARFIDRIEDEKGDAKIPGDWLVG